MSDVVEVWIDGVKIYPKKKDFSELLSKEFTKLIEENRSRNILWNICGYSKPFKDFNLLKIKQDFKELEGCE